jgi:hypothetical protein
MKSILKSEVLFQIYFLSYSRVYKYNRKIEMCTILKRSVQNTHKVTPFSYRNYCNLQSGALAYDIRLQ